MLLMLDNYDSSTYNIVQYFSELDRDAYTMYDNEIMIEGIKKLSPGCTCLSPGPCMPMEADVLIPTLEHPVGRVPIPGVCLGRQTTAGAFGGRVIRMQKVMHGKISIIENIGVDVFANLPRHFKVMRHHSLVIKRETLPGCLEITAWTEDDEIVGAHHKTSSVEGMQLHPELTLSEHGHALLGNSPKERV